MTRRDSVGATDHALRRWRERVDPGGTEHDLVSALLGAVRVGFRAVPFPARPGMLYYRAGDVWFACDRRPDGRLVVVTVIVKDRPYQQRSVVA